MNIKISEEHHERLCKVSYTEYIFGSRLFGTHKEDSDYDYMRIYNYSDVFDIPSFLPNIHSFQFDDKENNQQVIWVTKEQFFRNLYSGDSTMQSDIVMFSGEFVYSLQICRTAKVIRAYLGVARRDLKLHNSRNKLFHANRSYHIAKSLLENKLPTKKEIQKLNNALISKKDLLPLIQDLRTKLNQMYENKELENYYVPQNIEDDLLQIMIDANNTREFRYD